MKSTNNLCEETTFGQVYKEHAKPIWNFIYFKCGDTARADDLIQEAFIKLWQNCSKVSQEKAKSFLYTVSNRMFLNEVAHHKVVLRHAKLHANKVNSESPEFLLEEQQFHEKLQKAIANLTEAQRTVFLMNRIEGKKYHEMADILGLSVKAIEKRMSLALSSLRKEIKEM